MSHRKHSSTGSFTRHNIPHAKNSVDRFMRRGGVRL